VAWTSDGRTLGLRGIALVLLGAVLLVAAFRFLDWYSVAQHVADRPGRITFGTLHGNADQLTGSGAATTYFDWLAWLLLVAVVLVGVAANLPLSFADPCRVVGFLLGLVGAAATYFAIAQLHDAQVAAGAVKHNVFFNSTWGVWAAFVGFLLAALGAALGAGHTSRGTAGRTPGGDAGGPASGPTSGSAGGTGRGDHRPRPTPGGARH
jgi:uncharacterized membrane protein